MRTRRAVVGFALALGVVGLLVHGVGWEAVFGHLREANPAAFAAALLAGFGILVLRGMILHRLLAPIDGSARGRAFAVAFLAGYFARSALPWGRTAGTPITAYLLSRGADAEFEENLAAVATAEVFAFGASIVVALIGVGAYTATGDVPKDGLVRLSLVGVGTLLAVAVLVASLGRTAVRRAMVGLAARVDAATASAPGHPGEAGGVRTRLERTFTSLERLSAARRTLAIAFAFALCSWVVNVLPLYFSLLALGIDAPLALSLVCAPLASLAGVLPLPGGTGGIELALASLLVGLGALTVDVATAAALLYRLGTFWLHLVLGGAGALYLSAYGLDRPQRGPRYPQT